MTQPTLFDQPVQMQVHQREATEEGTIHVQKNQLKFKRDCKKLMMFWQRPSGNFWLSNEDGRMLGISSYLSARIYDVIKMGIPVEKKMDGNIKRFRLLCTCRHVHGQAVGGCYLHSQELKVK